MRLLAIAQPPDEYEAWLEGQRKPGSEPTTEAAKEGEKIFLAGPCSMCHMVRGTVAGGTVAPDLTHIGSRRMIASDVYDNNDAYLEAWITHAQSLKPEAQMPNLTQFSGEQLQDHVEFQFPLHEFSSAGPRGRRGACRNRALLCTDEARLYGTAGRCPFEIGCAGRGSRRLG
jgi:mono/diheme cytochrome c family protein